ncbi:MAG: hypothetical protein P1P77_14945 [Spirochaetaceae bacterium]|nr:hypothetical protein [Spirochaetaceae bacterium]
MIHVTWLLIAAVNLVIQIVYFKRDDSQVLFAAKKVTTPLLLFGGLGVSWLTAGSFPGIPGILLLAMGLGELGIEGSAVVEGTKGKDSHSPWLVTAAGVVFLLVNLFLGGLLLTRTPDFSKWILGLLAGTAFTAGFDVLLLRRFRPSGSVRFQTLAYSLGLAILISGAAADIAGGWGSLGRAAAILALSDSLVLVRMAANWNKDILGQRRTLLVFLVTIMLLYIFFIGQLISINAPFPFLS